MTMQYVAGQKPPRPILWPVSYDSAAPFWEAVKKHELKLQRCKSCGRYLHPPRPMCPKCRTTETEWVPSSGKGRVHSWTTYLQSPHPALKAPYSVVLVELEEGVRLVSNMVDCGPDEIRIGMPVELVFEDVAEDLILPRFKKA